MQAMEAALRPYLKGSTFSIRETPGGGRSVTFNWAAGMDEKLAAFSEEFGMSIADLEAYFMQMLVADWAVVNAMRKALEPLPDRE